MKFTRGNAMLIRSIMAASLLLVSTTAHAAGGPSKEMAKTVIEKELGYPNRHRILVHFHDAPLVLKDLIEDGYVESRPFQKPYSRSNFYRVTTKGKEYIVGAIAADELEHDGDVISIFARAWRQDVRVDEVLFDKASNEASIDYVVSCTRIEPFYSKYVSRSDEGRSSGYLESLTATKNESIKLKKYDKGWRRAR